MASMPGRRLPWPADLKSTAASSAGVVLEIVPLLIMRELTTVRGIHSKQAHIYIYIERDVYIYIYIYIYTHVYAYIYIYIYTYYASMYVYIYIYIYTYTHLVNCIILYYMCISRE